MLFQHMISTAEPSIYNHVGATLCYILMGGPRCPEHSAFVLPLICYGISLLSTDQSTVQVTTGIPMLQRVYRYFTISQWVLLRAVIKKQKGVSSSRPAKLTLNEKKVDMHKAWKQSKIPPVKSPKEIQQISTPRCAMKVSFCQTVICELRICQEGKYEEERKKRRREKDEQRLGLYTSLRRR